uniref:Uncharacterized protein n=1 Tax=Manihot esculenta TaxID=3983 RepID=A0A2C9UGP6_MANES
MLSLESIPRRPVNLCKFFFQIRDPSDALTAYRLSIHRGRRRRPENFLHIVAIEGTMTGSGLVNLKYMIFLANVTVHAM